MTTPVTNEAPPSDIDGLAGLLREAEEHHGAYEATAPAHHWSDWYAGYITARRAGRATSDAVALASRHVESHLDGAARREEHTTTTKVIAIYDNPTDPRAFESAYPAQLELAQQIPGLRDLESSKVWPKEDGSTTPAYRLLSLSFPDYDAASVAVTTEEAAAFFTDVFALATGGVRLLFANVEPASVSVS